MQETFFDARKEEYKTPFGAVEMDTQVRFCVRPLRIWGVLRAEVGIASDSAPENVEWIATTWTGMQEGKDCYTCTYSARQTGLFWYVFRFHTQQGVFYGNRGYGSKGVWSDTWGERFQLTVYDAKDTVPTWFGEGITYQIFPDRFARTRVPVPTGYPSKRVVHEHWEEFPVFLPNEQGEVENCDFFGGTLKGICEKLDRLQLLHVRTIYLNPIFEASSNHRYDTANYKKIDPMLGTLEDFQTLCKEASKRGMRILLDGVFNHTGYDSIYFNGRGHYDSVGAAQSKQSPYYDWFDFHQWPDQYASWWGIYTLPHVREESESYQQYMFDPETGVIPYWLRQGASGWRLDVADELPDAFIQNLHKAARAEKPDALILGEVWEDASNKIAYDVRRTYFLGNELDGVMNYPFREAVLRFLAGGRGEDFVEQMETLRENYPSAMFYNNMNSLGTHDTPRILTVLGSNASMWQADRSEKATLQLDENQLRLAKEKLWLAVLLQFTMPGSPCIYYGEEAGMQGFEDPFNRGTYPWGKEDDEIFSFYQALAQVRAQSKALTSGTIAFLQGEDGVLLFARMHATERYFIAINRSETEADVILPTTQVQEVLSGTVYRGEAGAVVLRLAPRQGLLLKEG